MGGTCWYCRALIATVSSMPAPIGCPVKPLVLAMTILDAEGPKAAGRLAISAAAEPPRAGV